MNSRTKRKDQARLVRLIKSDNFDLCSSYNSTAGMPLGSTVRPHSMSLTEEAESPMRSPISASVIPPFSRRSEMRDAQVCEAVVVMHPSLRQAVGLRQRPPVTELRDNLTMARPADLPKFKTLGPRLKYWREKRDLSRRDLGKKVGLKYSTIADIENEHSRATKSLHRIAAVLGLNSHYLETDEGDPEANPEALPPQPNETWPLPGIERKRIADLNRIERKYVESAIKDALAEIDEDRKTSRQTG